MVGSIFSIKIIVYSASAYILTIHMPIFGRDDLLFKDGNKILRERESDCGHQAGTTALHV
jgi:hypothetical protein